jgi:anion-transporting  ArsA/GET3 family ATPase
MAARRGPRTPQALGPELLDRRLIFVTGKGGVGKSTVAAALAWLASLRGKRVLVIEVDNKGDLTDMFEHRRVGFEPVQVASGISVLTMDTEASLREYLKVNLRVPMVGRIGPIASVFDFVATAAPGVKEILTIGKICWEVREAIEGRAPWDLVLVDAAASGHVIAQLGAPQAIGELVHVGAVHHQTEWLQQILVDPALTALTVVTTPEEMPVAETIDLVAAVRRELSVPLAAVFVNRVLPELLARADEASFDALGRDGAAATLVEHVGVGAAAVVSAGRLAVSLRRTRAAHLAHLQEAVDLPIAYVPELFSRVTGIRVTRMVADAIGEELGL